MNHLDIAPPGGAHRQEDSPANATADRLMVGGNPVYSAYFEGGMGYRINHGNGTAVADEPETMYMVTSGACGRAGERAGVGSITFSGGGCGVFFVPFAISTLHFEEHTSSLSSGGAQQASGVLTYDSAFACFFLADDLWSLRHPLQQQVLL